MGSPTNGIYIIQGELSLVVTAMRRSARWNTHGHTDEDADPLLSSFSQLKAVLNNITELADVEANAFLSPFLEVIRSEDTTGPITGLALTSVNKFLSYGLVDPKSDVAAPAIENIADAVTHARFVGTDPGSDEVVLMKILHVLRTLLLCPAGILLTNESVCEIMQSCFRICFEMRLSELLRKSAEHTLMDMVQLLFSRLPQFTEDPKWSANMKKLKMRTGGVDPARLGRRKKSPKPKPKRVKPSLQPKSPPLAPRPEEPDRNVGPLKEEDMLREGIEIYPGQLEPMDGVDTVDSAELAAEKVEDPGFEQSTEEIHDSMTEAGIAYVNATRESIATTPMEGTTIIDIVKGFQDQSIKDDETFECPDGLDSGSIPFNNSEINLNEHISLAIPSEDILTRSTSELSVASDVGDESVGDLCQSLPAVAEPSTETGEPSESMETVDGVPKNNFVNRQGVKFIPHQHGPAGSGPLIPYGLPCVRELFRFLISLTNPLDRHNTDVMIHMGLSLLTVALESGADHIASFSSLVYMVKDDMCRYLFLLAQSERLSLAAAALRVCFLLFESMRSHLKLQLEMYLIRLCDMITSDHPRITYEIREIALESIVHLWRIPGLVTELYLNYDCDLYCTSLFEDLTKLLSKNAFPVAGLFSTHLLSLDALLTVVDGIEQHCHSRLLNATKPGDPERAEVKADAKDGEGSVEDLAGTPTGDVGTGDRMVGPPTTGFCMAQRLLQHGKEGSPEPSKPFKSEKYTRKGPQIRPNRMKVNREMPSTEELMAIKQKKRIYQTGTEYFNQKPAKGIQYLQEQGLLCDPLDPGEVAAFLKENPMLEKKMIGEYITKRSNSRLLEAFVKSFHFEDLRIDETLRIYLEAFRLPGEAPVISLVMEKFADHWHKSNGEPFFNADAAFTLAYAVIMLNVDQHNHNVKKQNIPMTVEEFKKNLTKTNGGEDFEGEMLDEIYNAIRNEEIVMPAEHSGLVKENYLWKVLLKRGCTKEGLFTHAPTGAFDHDLFTLIWGPTVAALSFVFDKSTDEAIITKAISGFRKCAMISAHYGMSDVFDNLVISLCKFTTLLSSAEAPDMIPISFGSNMKAQLAARTVFGLAHRHGDILRDGWRNILDCMLQLYRAKLLPTCMIEVEDFVSTTGKICLIKEETQASQRDSGVLSSFYMYFTMSESTNTKGPTPEEQEATKLATNCIRDCHLEQLINDSKFLREESLHELVKALIFASQGPEAHESMGTIYDEDAAVFFFEQFVKCILQNRDRVNPIWQSVREHIYSLVVNATEHTLLVERAVVGLIRIAIRLLRREDVATQVLTSLQILLMMKPKVIHRISQQISIGLHDLLRTNAANIHSNQDWYTLFMLLEVVGAGANPPPLLQVTSGVDVTEGLMEAGAQSDSELPSASAMSDESDRGYTSDSELDRQARAHRGMPTELEVRPVPDNGSWLLVNKDVPYKKLPPINQFSIELSDEVRFCESKSLLKSSETLSFLVRDAAHVTPLNFESCVHAIRAFAEASLNGGRRKTPTPPLPPIKERKMKHKMSKKKLSKLKKSTSTPSHLRSMDSSDEDMEGDGVEAELHSLSIQLLDLMHTLHTRASSIYMSWAEEGRGTADSEDIDAGSESLWIKCWCPLLQGIARLCCDARRQVRGQALTYLQRALLVHDLQTLSAIEWEACFNKILFPLLTKLLENINTQDPSGMEETRMRASTLLCKVFLQHLSPLLSLSTFTALWLTILDFMDKYMHVDSSDLLTEAIPESLKNMLLVMDTAAIFQTGDGTDSQLWRLSWDRIGTFLPHLKDELFKTHAPEPARVAMDRDGDAGTPDTESSPLLSAAPHGAGETTVTEAVTLIVQDAIDNTADQQNPASVCIDMSGTSCLATEELPSTSSYFLHTPLPSLSDPNNSSTLSSTVNSDVRRETSGQAPDVAATIITPPLPQDSGLSTQVSPVVPLLLDPELMKGGSHIARGEPGQPSDRRPILITTPGIPAPAQHPISRIHDI